MVGYSPTGASPSEFGMASKTFCGDHTDHCTRLDRLEEGQKMADAKLDKLSHKVARWGGIAMGPGIVLLLWKLFDVLEPVARAAAASGP